MKRFYYSLITFSLSLLITLTGCTGGDGRGSDTGHAADSLYTEEAAMSIYDSDPERALVLIDSAVTVGNITPQRGQYLRAVTLYTKLNDYDLARQTCLGLIDAQNDSATVMQTLDLLTSIEMHLGNSPAAIRYAKEGSRLAHALGEPSQIAMFEGSVAQIMMEETEQKGEGIDRLRKVVDELRRMDSHQGVVAYHNTAKKLLHLLYDSYLFEEMVPVCEAMLGRYDELEQHPESFAADREGFSPTHFLDFARGQTYAFLTLAYAWQCSQWGIKKSDGTMLYFEYLKDRPLPSLPQATLRQKALEAEAAAFRTNWSKTSDCDKMLGGVYYHLGQWDRFDAAMDRLGAEWRERGDTISFSYRNHLQIHGVAAQVRGRHADALDYWLRAYIIKDSLEARNQREQLAELSTQYHLQEEQFARQKAEADARLLRWAVAAAVAIVGLAVAFALYFFYKRRETMKKNRVLAREIAEAIRYKEMWEEAAPSTPQLPNSPSTPQLPNSSTPQLLSSDADLFAFLRDAILRDQLFLDPQLDRQALVDRFGLSKERIGAAFAKGSSFKSLIDFLNDCRLPYAAKLLADRPDLSIADVARQSGFTSADTFGRNFKQRYTLTPSQYRESNGK